MMKIASIGIAALLAFFAGSAFAQTSVSGVVTWEKTAGMPTNGSTLRGCHQFQIANGSTIYFIWTGDADYAAELGSLSRASSTLLNQTVVFQDYGVDSTQDPSANQACTASGFHVAKNFEFGVKN